MKLISIVGARPQFIKLVPFSNEVKKINQSKKYSIEHLIVHTGQHYNNELSKIFFNDLNIPEPAYNLNVGSGLHGEQTGKMLIEIEKVLIKEQPDIVIIFGDTNSTLAGALASVKLNIPVAHIEAGLRSFNKTMPEEINRIAADHLSDLLFAPTNTAMKNLKNEGLKEKSFLSGDIMYDTVLHFGKIAKEKSDILKRLQLESDKYSVATIHRAENTDSISILQNILFALNKISEKIPVVFPVHPRTLNKIRKDFPDWIPDSGLKMIDPVGYLDMLQLVKNSRLILTDSGGLQKEAFFLGTPSITLRNETEWLETVSEEANYLAGTDYENINHYLEIILAKDKKIFDFSNKIQKHFGNGNSAALTIEIILNFNKN